MLLYQLMEAEERGAFWGGKDAVCVTVKLVFPHRVLTPLPPPIRIAMAGKNHLNEEITPLLFTGIGERFRQTLSNLGHAAPM